MKWKSPRCSPACWDEIKAHDALLSNALTVIADLRRDRDEWKQQHENLLAMYQAEVAHRALSCPDQGTVAVSSAKRE
jgi:hypothetical protein